MLRLEKLFQNHFNKDKIMKITAKLFINLVLIFILGGCHFFFPVWSHSKWEDSKLEVPFCSGSDKLYDVYSLKNKIDKNT